MPVSVTTRDHCIAMRRRFSHFRLEAWMHVDRLRHDPKNAEEVKRLAQVIAQGVTLLDVTRETLSAQIADTDDAEWYHWLVGFADQDLEDIRRAYRVALFITFPTNETMAAAVGWYSETAVAEAKARLA